MIKLPTPRSLRMRLTGWYALTVLVILLAFGFGSYELVHASLMDDLDRRLRADVELAEIMIDRRADGSLQWLGPLHVHDDDDEIDHVIWIEAWSPTGELEYRSELPDWLAAGLRPPGPVEDEPVRRLVGDGMHVRYLEKEFPIGGRPVILRAIRSEESVLQTLHSLVLAGLSAIPLAVVLAALGGYWMAGRALRPVARMAEQAGSITADNLSARLPVDDPEDELGRLAVVFNDTLARLERSFRQLRQFTSDVSHELRTPLASLRSVGELAMRDPDASADQREALGSMLEEVDRLNHLVTSLLTLSRADSGRVELDRRPLDLGTLVAATVDDLAVLAEEKNQDLVVETAGKTPVLADAQIVRVAIGNLIHNAITHCPAGTAIDVQVRPHSETAEVTVRDNGPGIPPEHQERVFDRFYRVDESRSRSEGGTGLGLAIARWAVEAHGGTLELASDARPGCIMRMTLPLLTDQRDRQRFSFR